MEPKTYNVYHEKRRWYVYFKPEKGRLVKRTFAYKNDTKELVTALNDMGYKQAQTKPISK